MSDTNTIKLKGYVVWEHYSWEDKPHFNWRLNKPSGEQSTHVKRVLVGESEIEVEIPVNFDPRPGMVAALEDEKRELQAKFTARITEINAQISNLQAIEFVGGAS